jgi:hypothetical protein
MSEATTRLAELSGRLRTGDFGVLRTALADEYFGGAPRTGESSAADTITDLVLALQDGMPDLRATLDDLTEHDDGRITATLDVRGTFDGNLFGAPGSGDELAWTTPVTIRTVGDRFAFRIDDLEGPQRVELIRKVRLVNAADEMHLPRRFPVVLPEFLLRLVFTGEAGERPCPHVQQIQVTEPTTDVCADCVATGDIWPALRMCLFCGYVGCCDTATNRHMAQHYQETGHPLFRSIHGDEGWIWCYACDAFFDKATLSSR